MEQENFSALTGRRRTHDGSVVRDGPLLDVRHEIRSPIDTALERVLALADACVDRDLPYRLHLGTRVLRTLHDVYEVSRGMPDVQQDVVGVIQRPCSRLSAYISHACTAMQRRTEMALVVLREYFRRL